MSLRSQRSTQSRGPPTHLTDEELLRYCLKVAILARIQANRPAPPSVPLASTSVAALKQDGYGKRESLKRSITEGSSGWSSSFAGISLADLFKGDIRNGSSTTGASSARYPERFVKVLEQKIENISRGTDSTYADILLRYTIGAFYGKFKDSKNARAIKEIRKLEDLLMMFISTATDVLRKRCTGDEWKLKLEGQVESFVKICEDCLRHKDVKHVPPELFVKLDTLKTKISANRPPSEPSVEPTVLERSSTDQNQRDGALGPHHAVSYHVADMPVVQQIGRIFGVDSTHLQQEVTFLKKQCTEKVCVDIRIWRPL